MIDGTQTTLFFHLEPIAEEDVYAPIKDFLIDGETIFAAFQTVRDQLVFTNKRIVFANKQGLTGKKIDYSSIPYSKIQAFSVETSGTFDRDVDFDILMSAFKNPMKFRIKKGFDVLKFTRMISEHIL